MAFGNLAVDMLATPSQHGEIHFIESDEVLWIRFVTDTTLLIECEKLVVLDMDGESTCQIATRNGCRLRSAIVFKSEEPLDSIFTFLVPPVDTRSIEQKRGNFDIFINAERFYLGFYIDSVLIQGGFRSRIFSPGCYSDCSSSFMELNEMRQTIFKTKSAYLDKRGIDSPI